MRYAPQLHNRSFLPGKLHLRELPEPNVPGIKMTARGPSCEDEPDREKKTAYLLVSCQPFNISFLLLSAFGQKPS
jgi:hypothetical protein